MTRLLALLLLLLPSLAWADAGFIQAVPGTGRATCESITNPVTNQTWCADASGAATNTYTWKVWNGTTYIPITGGGGGGGTPGAPTGSTQFNNAGAFGGVLAPTQVAAFGTNGTAIQNAINATPDGGVVQLAPVAYTTAGVTTISITKAITIQGTNLGMSYTPDAAATTNSQITGAAGQIIFTVNTGKAVVFRDLSLVMGAGGTGISLSAAIVNGQSKIERVAFYGGAKGVLGVEGKTIGTTVKDNYFYQQTVAGTHFGGYRNPNALIGGQPTNCDGGGYTFDNNYFFGSGGDTGMLFDNSAAVSMTSNQGTGFNHMLRIRVGVSSPCVGPGPTQWQVRGNQFELNGRTGPTVHLEDTYGTGLYEFVGNFFGATQSLVNTAIVQLDVTFLFGFVFANNTTGGGVGPSVFVHGLIQDSSFSDNSLAFPVFFITGNITSGSPIITNINLNTSFMPIGTTVSGAGIPIGAKVLTVDSPTQVTMTQNATATTVANLMGVASQPALRIDAASYGVMVTNNTMPNPVPGHKHWDCDGCTIISPYNGDHAQNLSTLPAAFNGSEMFCTDCSRTQPCITGGVGATARRVEGAWLCLDQAPTFTGAGLSESNTALQNRTNLLAMIAALPVAGGRIQLPTGTLNIDNTTPIVIDKAVVLDGASGASPSGTVFLPSSGAQDVFLVTANFPVHFQHFTIRRDTAATAGAFIHLNASSGLNGLSVIDDVTLVACFVCLDVEAANAWHVKDSFFLPSPTANAVGIQVRSTDAGRGGGIVEGSQFGNGSALATGITITSGANFNIHHNFFFQMANHVLVDWTPATNVVGGAISNNTFGGGNVATDGISLRTQGGGGTFTDLIISNNTFSSFTTANITSTAGALYNHVVVSGNTLPAAVGQVAIDTRLSAMNITGNIISGNAALAGINIQAAAVNTNACGNLFVGTFTNQIADAGTNTSGCLSSSGGTVVVPGGTHGESTNIKSFTEETTILAAAFTDTAAQFPAGSTSLGCTTRVTTVIPTAATFDLGVSGDTTRYATGIATAATSTGGAAVFSAYTSATSVRMTPNLVPGAATGKVRVSCSYIDMTPPSS